MSRIYGPRGQVISQQGRPRLTSEQKDQLIAKIPQLISTIQVLLLRTDILFKAVRQPSKLLKFLQVPGLTEEQLSECEKEVQAEWEAVEQAVQAKQEAVAPATQEAAKKSN